MTLEILGKNIEREKNIMEEVLVLQSKLEISPLAKENEIMMLTLGSLLNQLKIINRAIPELISGINFYHDLKEKENKVKNNIVSLDYEDKTNSKVNLGIKKSDEPGFLKNLATYNETVGKLKNNSQVGVVEDISSGYVRLSNKLFRKISDKFVDRGYFDSLRSDLRSITSLMLVSSYVSIMFFSTLIAIVFGFFIGIILLMVGLSPSISLATFVFVPLLVFFSIYLNPSFKRRALEKEINQELPFLIIYMAAISTSGIEPSKIFDILVSSKDYPVIRREIKKLTNYINFYGNDLITALKNVSRNCPSERLAQLFNGMATTITSGGELTEFLNKHSETLLFDYRLEREKYTHVAETFMNIYISVVIAAPMIMMMLFILMSLTGFASGYLSPLNIGLLSMLIVGLLNLGFLLLLNIKQPKF